MANPVFSRAANHHVPDKFKSGPIFLKLARHMNADYGDVLSYADWLINVRQSTYWQERAIKTLTDEQKAMIAAVQSSEYERRKSVCQSSN